MSWVATATIGSAVVGGYMANQAAKKQAGAMSEANQLNAMGYMDVQPYIKDMYSGGTNALNNVLSTGAYQGDIYAGMNPMQTATMNNMYNYGGTGFTGANNLMGTTGAFGQNAADLYNMAGQDRMATAQQYALDNSQPLIDRALRDSTRNLEENTLRNIGMGASASGNANSSRAGVAEAIAGRDYMDRASDTAAGIQDDLMRRSLTEQDARFNNQMSANQQMSNIYNTAFGMGQDALKMQGAAGDIMQSDQQQQLNADKAKFESNRDFELDMYNKYNAGILGRAPQTANVQPNMVDPTMATMGGAMAGFGFGQNYLAPMFNQQQQPAPMQSPYMYNPSQGYSYAQSPAGGTGGSNPYIY
jgi:hypothetical protein